MDKIDEKLLSRLKSKLSSGIVKTLECSETVDGLVRVRNPLQLSAIDRHFEVIRTYPFIRTVGIRLKMKDLATLERMGEVEYVASESRAFTLAETVDFSEVSEANNLLSVENHKKLTGEGVTLCVMDTGVAIHSDLSVPKERIVHFEDFISGETEPYDDNGHGTFVASVAAGNGTLSGGRIKGVAPKANIIGVKVIEESGESGAFKILDGMQWLFDNFRLYDVKVVCMSFGAEPQEHYDPLRAGAEMLARSGLVVVAASGNSGVGNLKSPAVSREVIAVGAVNSSNSVASFTSRGTFEGVSRPDVYADGVDVKGAKVNGTYSKMSGTSASAPYVAGACCLICEANRGIAPDMVKRIIINNSVKVDGNLIFRM